MTIEQKIYDAVVEFCERKEPGMDSAKELSKHIAIALLPPGEKRVYDVLTYSLQSASEIACQITVKTNLNIVSAVLHKLSQETTLVAFNNAGAKHRKWYKS